MWVEVGAEEKWGSSGAADPELNPETKTKTKTETDPDRSAHNEGENYGSQQSDQLDPRGL